MIPPLSSWVPLDNVAFMSVSCAHTLCVCINSKRPRWEKSWCVPSCGRLQLFQMIPSNCCILIFLKTTSLSWTQEKSSVCIRCTFFIHCSVTGHCPSFFVVAVINTMTKSDLGKEGLFGFQITVHHGEKPRQELGGRHWGRTTNSIASFPCLALLSFLCHPRRLAQGLHYLQWAGLSHINQ